MNFCRKTDAEIDAVAAGGGCIAPTKCANVAHQLHESNPMLGHRGCRLGISYPEIYEMQVRAIFSAAADMAKQGKNVMPEIMIPLIATQ